MRGSLTERHGSYLLRVSLGMDPVTKKYRYYSETVQTDSKPLAEKRLREVLTQYDKGILTKPSKDNLAEYLARWIEDYCRPNLSPRSTEGYEYLINKYIVPKIGSVALKSLRPDQVQALYTSLLKQGLSNRTVRYVHVTLHKALKSALKQGLISRNVTEQTDPPKPKRKEMAFIEECDIAKFLKVAKNSPYYSMAYLFLTSGLRRSELLALRWSDISFVTGLLSVTRTLQRHTYGPHISKTYYKEPKTQHSRRSIPLPASAIEVLKQEYQNQLETKKSLYPDIKPENLIKSDDLIFCRLLDGSPLRADTVSHAFRRLALEAGLKGIHTHSLRHSHASLLLALGVHLKIVQERLGHSSIQVTGDIYSHVGAGLQEAAIKKFDILMPGNKALMPR